MFKTKLINTKKFIVMSYKIIEKNEYGVLVVDSEPNQNISDVCNKCKYLDNCEDEWMHCIINTYYIPDSEVERLELENDLKAKNEALIKFLEDNIDCCKIHEIQKNSTDPVDIATVAMYITYKNVLEFIKNQK